MSPEVKVFFESIFLSNPVFMVFAGSLLAAAGPEGTRSSFRPALKYAVVFAAAGGIGGLLGSAAGPEAAPAVYTAVAIASALLLVNWGELKGEWLGIPKVFLAAAPLAGLQITASGYESFSLIVSAAAGSSLGFAWAYIVIGSIREFSKISEAPDIFKTYPVVLFSMAVFALVMPGFLFY